MSTSLQKFLMTSAAVFALLVSSSATYAQLRADVRADVKDGQPGARGGAPALLFEVGSSLAPWEGFMNVFDLIQPEGAQAQGPFVFGSGWGVSDLTATFDDVAGVLTLGPNSVGDPDPFWYVGGGGPGAQGNKWMDANLFQTQVIGANAGATVTFSGEVLSNTLTPAHTAVAFIREFNADFSSLVLETTVPLTPGPFSFSQTLTGDTTGNFQFGFSMNGQNVWVTDVAPFGTVEIASEMGTPPELNPLATFCSDFEDLVPDSQFLPIGDGWTFFATDPVGTYDGPAPQGPQISNLADASGDPGNTLFQENGTDDDSNQYLNIYSDYDNPLRPGGGEFGNNVFQQQTFTAEDAARGRPIPSVSTMQVVRIHLASLMTRRQQRRHSSVFLMVLSICWTKQSSIPRMRQVLRWARLRPLCLNTERFP